MLLKKSNVKLADSPVGPTLGISVIEVETHKHRVEISALRLARPTQSSVIHLPRSGNGPDAHHLVNG